MSIQSEFPFVRAPIPLKPAQTKAHPALWVERLAIYKALPVRAGNELRTMTLHRGLNILWAEPGAPRGAGQPRSKVSSHATGKTTFSRFLRYVLGDTNFGNDVFRTAFRSKFPQGWALAEVWVDRRRWLVGRPLGIGPQHFTVPGGTIDDLIDKPTAPQDGWHEYLAAVDAAIFAGSKERELPASGMPLGWDMLLQWLARNQECRYSGLLAWRNPASQSLGIELQETEKESIVRFALGLTSEQEQPMLREFASAAKDHKAAVGRRGTLDNQLQTDMDRLARLLNMDLSLNSPLPEELVSQKIADLDKQAVSLRRKMDEDPELKKLREQLQAAEMATQTARVRWTDAEESAEALAEEIEIAEGNRTEQERAHKKRDWKPFRWHCSQLLTEEVRKECRFAQLRPSDDALDSELRSIRSDADARKYEKALLDQEVMHLFATLQARESDEADLKSRVSVVEARYKPSLERADELETRTATARVLKTNLIQALKTKEENEQTIASLSSTKDKLERALEAERVRHRTRLREFSDLYRFVIKELLGEEIDAGVDWSGKSISPFVNYHGKLDSAALETVRLLAFDVTALADAYIREASVLPRFLLHDSLREADLSVDIYLSLFWLMERLEREVGDLPPFQYIITTTEPPPGDLRKDRWLLHPVLRTTEDSQRFLGVAL